MTAAHDDNDRASAGMVSDHAPEDLTPQALTRELRRAQEEYGEDRVAGVPLALIPCGLLERVLIALQRLRAPAAPQPREVGLTEGEIELIESAFPAIGAAVDSLKSAVQNEQSRAFYLRGTAEKEQAYENISETHASIKALLSLVSVLRALAGRLASRAVDSGGDARDAARYRWIEAQRGNLFTPGLSFRATGWAWFGDDGKRLDGATLGELIDSQLSPPAPSEREEATPARIQD